ncbi:MAG: hypothetical protein ABSE48_22300 [Verrucomicrobiota bacterium]
MFLGVLAYSLVFLNIPPPNHRETEWGTDTNGQAHIIGYTMEGGPSALWKFGAFTSILLGIVSPLGMTALGWLAVSQIRRSAGTLYGLALALFDGLFFPLFIVNGPVLIFCFCRLYVDVIQGAMLALLVMAPLLLLDYFVVRRVWRFCLRRLRAAE